MREPAWWERKREPLLAIAAEHQNAYVYDLETVSETARRILALREDHRSSITEHLGRAAVADDQSRTPGAPHVGDP